MIGIDQKSPEQYQSIMNLPDPTYGRAQSH
jgi:hypothetical protein